jgi:ankyrin repeat protein
LLLIDARADVNAVADEGPPLFFARNAKMVNMLVDAGADVDYQSSSGWAPLLMAVKNNDVGIIRALLNRNADVSIGTNPLTAALSRPICVDTVKALLESPAVRALVNKRASGKNMTPLGMAALGSGGDSVALVRALVDANANVNMSASAKEYPITLATCPQVARALLEANADCSKEARHGATALWRACESKNINMVTLLLQHKADPVTAMGGLRSLLDFAVKRGHKAFVKLLLSIEAVDHQFVNTLHIAVECGNIKMVNMLLEAHVHPNKLNHINQSPLMFCTNIDIAKKLLAEGADPCLANNRGENALMAACRRGDGEMVHLLLENRADVNVISKSRETALLIALEKGDIGIVRRLLVHVWEMSTVSLNLRNKDKDTALMLAIKRDDVFLVRMLVSGRANVNLANGSKNPLQSTRNYDIVRILLDAGAKDSPFPRDSGTTALIEACKSGNLPLVRLLLEYQSRNNAISVDGDPLIVAAGLEKLDILKTLLAANPPPEMDPYGDKALLRAAEHDNPSAMRVLVAAGADPLSALTSARNPACVKRLVEAIPDVVDMANEQGYTALMWWSKRSKMIDNQNIKLALIRELLESSERCGIAVDVNKRNAEGLSALDEALGRRCLKTVRLLITHGAAIGATTVLEALRRTTVSMNTSAPTPDDKRLSAYLRTIFKHALATGSFEQPAAPRVAALGDVEEEEPALKRRRLD